MKNRFLFHVMFAFFFAWTLTSCPAASSQEAVVEEVAVEAEAVVAEVAAAVESITVSGVVAAVEEGQLTVTVAEATDENPEAKVSVSFLLDGSTEIVGEGEGLTVANLKAGDSVTVEYVLNAEGQKVAKSVWLE